MTVYYKASVMCMSNEFDTGRSCTEVAHYTGDPLAMTLEEFGSAAMAHFRDSGWRCSEPYPNHTVLCPSCRWAVQMSR